MQMLRSYPSIPTHFVPIAATLTDIRVRNVCAVNDKTADAGCARQNRPWEAAALMRFLRTWPGLVISVDRPTLEE